MLIKALSNVLTEKERTLIKDVRWGKVSSTRTVEPKTQRGVITGVWKFGCSMTTRENLLRGDTIWLKAKDDFGQPLLSLIGIVTWNENHFSPDGYRCEIRFRETPDMGAMPA